MTYKELIDRNKDIPHYLYSSRFNFVVTVYYHKIEKRYKILFGKELLGQQVLNEHYSLQKQEIIMFELDRILLE